MNIALIVILITTVAMSFKGFDDRAFFSKYQFHIGSIRSGEYLRLFSSAFLHADISHLAFNMYTLYLFAPIVIVYLGTLSFVIIYFTSLLLGSLLTIFFHKNDYGYTAIGASGAVMGVLYSAILLRPDIEIWFIFPAYIYGILYLFYSIYGMKSKNDNIGHTAHFGGAIGGYLLTLYIAPQLLVIEPLVVVLLASPIVMLFVLIKLKKI